MVRFSAIAFSLLQSQYTEQIPWIYLFLNKQSFAIYQQFMSSTVLIVYLRLRNFSAIRQLSPLTVTGLQI
jgi:hypothetical protein